MFDDNGVRSIWLKEQQWTIHHILIVGNIKF